MRGTPHVTNQMIADARFIPAYAGNASVRNQPKTGQPVHPRVCGERACISAMSLIESGSSPRMRGTPTIECWPILSTRFIPAYAGNASKS